MDGGVREILVESKKRSKIRKGWREWKVITLCADDIASLWGDRRGTATQ